MSERKVYQRYAIYHILPDSPLYGLGASWLGWDVIAGGTRPHPEGAPQDVEQITRTPRRYGLHATIKPPFYLAPTQSVDALEEAMEQYCAAQAAVTAPPLHLTSLGRFLALTHSAPAPEVNALAAGFVRHFDPFRAAPGADELAKRRARGLTPAQDALLTRWGYPYVMEEFRFHITLTGPLSEASQSTTRAWLQNALSPHLQAPHDITDMCLAGQDTEGRFHLINRFPLGGGEPNVNTP